MEESKENELLVEQSSEKKEKKTVRKIVWDIVSWVLIVICFLFAASIIFAKIRMPGEDSATNIFGNEMRIVLTGSMTGSDEFYDEHPEYEIKDLPVDTLLFIKKVPVEEEKRNEFYEDLEVGDVITFYWNNTSMIVTHRIIDIKGDATTGYTYYCRGDNPNGDQRLPENDRDLQIVTSESGHVIGKVTGSSYPIGWVVKHVAQNKVVLILVIIVPSFIMMVYEIFKIFYILSTEKNERKNKEENEKRAAELEKRDAELDELKRQIEELKKIKEKGE